MLDRARVRQVFAEAVELPGDQVAAFLDRECGSDAALREEVESLLAAALRRPAFLGAPTASASGSPTAAGGEAAGMTIGHYRLLEEIGQGGFGSVYAAEQLEPVRRRVAVKIIKLGMDTRAVIARFEAERQALAMMDHANIARVFDAGATESGRPYFVMELVRGEPITTYCDRKNLSIAERLDVFVQVCRAVQHAHSKGVIHRDIKPGNVLVATEDGRPHAKVIDFGIAKATERRLTEKTVFTEFRQFIGTPEYMSPEQAEGSLSADTRTDVYSLGVLLYELLTGATPFDPKALRSAAFGEVQRIIREVEPPKPSTRLSHSGMLAEVAHQRRAESSRLCSLVRGDLDWIVMRCLEKDRSRRYDTVEALAADVGRHLTGEPVVAAPPSKAYRVRKFIARHRLATVAGGIVAATLVLGVAGTSVGLVQARAARADAVDAADQATANAEHAGREAKRADAQAEEASASARVAEGVNQLMTSMIGRADRAKEEGRTDVTVREVMDAAAADLEAGVGMREPRVVAMLARTIGDTYDQLSLLEQAEQMRRLHHRMTRELFGEKSLEHASSMVALGDIVRKRGSEPEAKKLYASARAITADLGDAGVEMTAWSIMGDALIDAYGGHEEIAIENLRGVLSLLEGKGLGASQAAVVATHNLAATLFRLQKYAEAQAVYQRSLGLIRARGEEPDRLEMLTNLAVIQTANHDFAEAEKSAEEAVAVTRRLYGDRHLQMATALDTYMMILQSRDKPAEAINAGRESVAIKRALLKPGHRSISDSIGKLAATMFDAGEYTAAEPLLREEFAAKDGPQDPGGPGVVYTRYELAVVVAHLGNLAEAESILRRVLADTEATMPATAKYWWMRGASGCVLARVVAELAEKSADPEERVRRMVEATQLVSTYAERMLGPERTTRSRPGKLAVRQCFDHVIAACEAATRVVPGPERESLAVEWRARRAQFLAENPDRK